MMNGLYQRALEIYRQDRKLHLARKGDEDRGIEDIPAEERENILREIDGLLAQNRIGTETPLPKGGKSGVALPFLVNLLILAAVVAAIFFYTRASNSEEKKLSSGVQAIRGAESQLVEALKRESAAEIGQKDQAIVEFQKKLAEATERRKRLDEESAAALKQREAELSTEMASALEAERRRLRESGMEAAAADESLKSLEEKLKAEASKAVEDFQKKAAEETAKSAAAADSLIAEYERSLNDAQGERSRLQAQYQSRENELKSLYAAETQTILSEKNRALADLDRIEAQRRQEDLVTGTILASYDEVNSRIAAKKYDAALESLAGLRAFLDRDPARSLAAVQKRRPVELFLLGSLEDLVHSRAEQDKGGVAALIEASNRLGSIREISAQAEREYLRKDYGAARALYLSALAELPEIRVGHERLEAMAIQEGETELATKKAEELNSVREAARAAERQALAESIRRSGMDLVAGGESLLREGSWQAALDRYEKTLGLLLGDTETAASLVAQVSQAGYRLGAEKDAAARAVLPDRIAAVRKELAQGIIPQANSAIASASASGASPAAQPGIEPKAAGSLPATTEIASLLRAKLLLWQIIGTDPIKSKYPGLYDTMQKYFDSFASEARGEGREAALNDILALTEAIGGGETAGAVTALKADPASERETLVRLLDGLEGLLRR